MAQIEALLLSIHGGDHGQKLLPHLHPVRRMADTGYGEGFNREQGNHSAAHIHKRPEGLQVSDPAGHHHAGLQMLQHPAQGFFLRHLAGEKELRASCFIRRHLCDTKAYGLANPGENGDLPFGAADGWVNGLRPGDAPGKDAQRHRQIVVFLTAEGYALQNGFIFYGCF